MNYVIHRNQLAHHGILGMKWGKKNGPPYPLDYADHSPKEKRLMTKTQKEKTKGEKPSKSGLSDADKKKLLKAGAIAAGIGLAAVGGYALYKSGVLNKLVGSGKSFVGNIDLSDDVPRTEIPRTEVPRVQTLKTKSVLKENLGKSFEKLDMSMIKSINDGNPLSNSGNCTNTSAVYILNSLFGGKFQAKSLDEGRKGIGADLYKDLFKGINEIKTNNNPDNVYDGYKIGKRVIDQIPNGSTGILLTVIPGANGTGRHAVNYEKSLDGVFSIVEGKYGRAFSGNMLTQNVIDSYGYVQRILDFSNAELADGVTMDTIKKFAR